ncbi:MAG TPA: DUF1223 domain-containing protein [Povalibacter sp.]|nr:DUF1223 domain-containing protein [Povalibacter sp.]
MQSILTMTALFTMAFAATSTHATPVVVELFTSQGCSSCPPADALLGEIARRPQVVALAWHVDYWDRLGWKDPFSIAAATRRQRNYVQRMSRAGAFTPQAVVSGDTSLIGSDRAAMERALAEKRDAIAIRLSQTDTAVQIEFPERWHGALDVYVVSFLDEATTPVGRGENAHRTLKEFNIVRSIERLGKWNGSPQRMSVARRTVPRDATSVAVLLQRSGQGAIAGAATLRLR